MGVDDAPPADTTPAPPTEEDGDDDADSNGIRLDELLEDLENLDLEGGETTE